MKSIRIRLIRGFQFSCKPQLAHTILGEQGMWDALDGKLLISILAGVTIHQLTDLVPPSTKVIRAMPNTPCKVSEKTWVCIHHSIELPADP
jgi:pyrroline-5-carboxylate reductase